MNIARRTTLASLLGLALATVAGAALAADGPAFTITAPAEGATVTSPVTVTVAVEGSTIGRPADGLDHLHIAVDEGKARSLYENTPQVLELAPGEHTVWIELAGPNHRALLPKKSVTFTVK